MATQPVLHVVSPMWPSPEHPHIGIFVENLSSALAAAGFVVEPVALIRGRGVGPLQKARAHALLAAGLLQDTLRRADILYVHAPSWFAPLVSLSALPRHKKVVVHLHGGEASPHSRMEHLARPAVARLCRRADLVVAPSAHSAELTARAFGLDPARLFVSPSGGVDTRRFVPGDRAAARRALGLPTEGAVVGFVGRIEAQKGWEVYVDALALLIQDGHPVTGLAVGAGGDASRLAESAQRLGVPLVRRGLVPQADLPTVYAAMDALLFPTRRAEALGLVPIEALACGVPVVGSDRFAVPEYVIPGETGHLVAPLDAPGFARAVGTLLARSPAEVARMAKAARAMAERYDARRGADALAERLRALIQ
ncbi:MAG: glycosyltransferase family 4 protein [Myxococcales bacterium]|nr:glycosyltransferase family 4 protein [Myxococcales bacterium]